MKMNNLHKPNTKFLLLLIVLLVVSIVFYLGFNSLAFGTDFFNPNCYTEKNYFINQEIRQTDLCPDGCLYIFAYRLLANDPHISQEEYRKVYRTYYFKNEKELVMDDIKIHDEFNVKWCKIKGIGYRIRGVWV